MAGFTTGFLHPLSGWDHTVAMVAELGLFDQDREGVGDSPRPVTLGASYTPMSSCHVSRRD